MNDPVPLRSAWALICCVVLTIPARPQGTSRSSLVIGLTGFAQTPAVVSNQHGPFRDVRPAVGLGANGILSYAYAIDSARTHWIAACMHYGAYVPRVLVSMPTIDLDGISVGAYSVETHPGGYSGSIRQWSLSYNRSLLRRTKGEVQCSIGVGILETTITYLVGDLGFVNDTTFRGEVVLDYGILNSPTPIVRTEALYARKDQGGCWSVGLSLLLSGKYVGGGYVLLPGTSFESTGRFLGRMSYVGLTFARTIRLPKCRWKLPPIGKAAVDQAR